MGLPGIEPSPCGLETHVRPLHYSPVRHAFLINQVHDIILVIPDGQNRTILKLVYSQSLAPASLAR